jgi:hypothetical protein
MAETPVIRSIEPFIMFDLPETPIEPFIHFFMRLPCLLHYTALVNGIVLLNYS